MNLAQNRRLAAIMFTDIVGYSRLTNQNPLLARELNEEHQKIVREYVKKCEGLERQTTGDGFFLEFKSAAQAMSCAIEIQQALYDRNLTRASENQIQIRIGLHLGDIFEKNGEIFGDGVNIAARLEALSDPAGVCLSKTFYDLVKSSWAPNKFSSLGNFNLKNIQDTHELFRFNFPWHKQKKSRIQRAIKLFRSLFNQEQWSLASLFVLGVALLLFIFAKVFVPQFQTVSNVARAPSSNQSVGTLLDRGWAYSTNQKDWNEFIPKESWRYADLIRGSYQLKNEFVIAEKPIEPALVLGLISDSHRVFLNDHYIGGSEHLSDLAAYNIDPSLLKISPEKNILLVRGYTRPSLNPGIILLEDAKPQIGEFTNIHDLHSKYFFKFYILKNIYFVFSLIIFVLSLTYAIYLRNKNEIFYSSLFLLLGCLSYAYYNPWVSSTFDYQFLRFLRVSCILMSSFILYSGYLASRRKTVVCSWNNFLALVIGVSSFCIFNFYPFFSAKDFVSVYNGFLFVGLIYILAVGGGSLVQEFFLRKSLKKEASSLEPRFFLFFALFSLFNILGAFKNSQTDAIFSTQMRTWINDIGVSIAFLFAIARVTIAVFEFTQQKRLNIISKKKDEFFLEMTKVVSESRSTLEKIESIQKLAHQYLKSERSVLYVVDSLQSHILKPYSMLGYSIDREQINSATEGVFKYVLQNRRPLLIEDVEQDYRFDSKELKSGSCMIFPLVLEQRPLGVILFLDKENGQKYTLNDLEIGLKMSTFVSLLISGLNENKEAG